MATKQKSALQQALDSVSQFAGNVGSTIQKTFTTADSNFEKTGQSIVNNFTHGLSETGRTASKLGIGFNNPLHSLGGGNTNYYPKFGFTDSLTKNIQNPVVKFVAQAAVGIPESILNSPHDLKQAEIQTNKDIVSGKILDPRVALSDAGSTALPLLNFMGGGTGGTIVKNLGKQTLKTALKEGALTGAKYGAGFGLSGGLKTNRDTQNPLEYLTSVGTQTAMGAGIGSLMGGVFEPILYLTGQKGIKPALEIYNKMTPEQKQAGFARFFLEFPEKIDKQKQLAIAEKQGWFKSDFLERLDKGQVSAGDLGRLGIKITKTDMRTLLRNAPELAQNPTLKFENGLLRFEGQKIKFGVNPEAVGIDPATLQAGDTVNISAALTQKGKIPVLMEKSSLVKLKQPEATAPQSERPKVKLTNASNPENGAIPTQPQLPAPSTDIGMLPPQEQSAGLVKLSPDVPSQGIIPYSKELVTLQDVKPVFDAGEMTVTEAQDFTTKWNQAIDSGAIKGERVNNFPNPPEPPKSLPQGATADDALTYTYGRLDKFYTEMMDRFHPLSHAAGNAGEDQAMRKALTGYYGIGSIGKYHTEFELKPILNNVPLADLRTAGIAMRDIELAGRDIQGSNFADIDFSKEGAGSAQAKEAAARLQALKEKVGPEGMQKIGDTLNRLYEYQDGLVKKYLVGTGVMSEAQYNAMKAKNKFYIPFKRQMDFVEQALGMPPRKGAGSVSSNNVIKGMKGSSKDIIDPIESIIENTFKIVSLGKRQDVARAIVNLRDKLPVGTIEEIKGPVGARPSIGLLVDGKTKHYAVPQEIADAAKGLTEEQLNTIVKIFAAPTKVFRATATGINPEFALPNVLRDLQSAFVNVGLNPLSFVRGFSHYIKQDAMYQQFLKSGGQTARVSLDRPYLQEEVRNLAGKGFPIKKPSDVYHLLENFGAYSEQPTRIAAFEKVYNQGIKAGLSAEEANARAAYAAQEATVNFARRGSKTQSLNAIYAFMNARAQGTDRLLRTLKENPKTAAARLAMITAAPAVATYAWNRDFKSYNDDRIVSKYDKQNNFIIMLSDTPIKELGGAQYIKIPKGDVGRFANPLEEFMSYMDGKGGDVTGALGQALASFSPASNFGDLIPTTLRPPVEAAANYNFFYGQPIVPDYKKNYPAEYQATSQTMPVYKGIANKLTKVGIHLSPAQMQNMAEGYGTGYAKIAGLVSQIKAKSEGDTSNLPKGADINRIPVIRRVLGGEKRTEAEQQANNDKAINSINYNMNDIKAGINRGDIPMDEGLKQLEDLQKQQQDLMNKSAGVTTGGKIQAGKPVSWLENGKLQQVDIEKYTKPATGIQKYQLDVEKYKTARDIFEATGLSDQQKNDIYKKLKVAPEDVQYDYLASQPTTVKGPYLYDTLTKEQDHNKVLETLVQGRIESVSGDMFVNNATVDDLYERGLISQEEAKYIKGFKFNKKGENLGSGAKVGVKKPKKISFPKATAPKISSPKLAFNTPKSISPLKLKYDTGTKITPKKTKLGKPSFKANPIKVKLRTPSKSIRTLGRV